MYESDGRKYRKGEIFQLELPYNGQQRLLVQKITIIKKDRLHIVFNSIIKTHVECQRSSPCLCPQVRSSQELVLW
jgi:hypothetical protein